MMIGSTHIRNAVNSAELDRLAHFISIAHKPDGQRNAYYEPAVVYERIIGIWRDGATILFTEQDGAILACGALVPVNFSRQCWALSLGATRSDLQGRGLGHALVEKRLQLAADRGAGTIVVSAHNAARWIRYGFKAVSVNPVTGSSLMIINLDWRA